MKTGLRTHDLCNCCGEVTSTDFLVFDEELGPICTDCYELRNPPEGNKFETAIKVHKVDVEKLRKLREELEKSETQRLAAELDADIAEERAAQLVEELEILRNNDSNKEIEELREKNRELRIKVDELEYKLIRLGGKL